MFLYKMLWLISFFCFLSFFLLCYIFWLYIKRIRSIFWGCLLFVRNSRNIIGKLLLLIRSFLLILDLWIRSWWFNNWARLLHTSYPLLLLIRNYMRFLYIVFLIIWLIYLMIVKIILYWLIILIITYYW